jgi:hypothetical protein
MSTVIAKVVYSDSDGNSESYPWKTAKTSPVISPTEMAAKVFTDLFNFIDSNAGYDISVTVSSSDDGGGMVPRVVLDKLEELLNEVEGAVDSLRGYTYELNTVD